MANIGQFTVTTTWTKISDISSSSYAVGATYLIQNKGFPTLLLCESPTQPAGTDVGFSAKTDDKVLYTCKSGEYLWLRALANTTQINIAEGE